MIPDISTYGGMSLYFSILPSYNTQLDWNQRDVYVVYYEDTKGVIRSHKSKKGQTTQWPKEIGQRDKQRSTKHYTEN